MRVLISVKLVPEAFTAAWRKISGPSGVSRGGKLAGGAPPYSWNSRASALVKPAL
jgi:hypothetical protein